MDYMYHSKENYFIHEMELSEYIVCVSDYDLSTEDGPEKFPDSPEVDPPPLPPLPPGRLHPGQPPAQHRRHVRPAARGKLTTLSQSSQPRLLY